MRRVLTTVLAVALLLGLGALAVLALPNANAPLAGAPAVSAAAPEYQDAPLATNNYNVIGMPLNSTNQFTSHSPSLGFNSDGLADLVGSSVTQVLQWNKALQGFDSWDPVANDGTVDGLYTETPFPLAVGGAYWLLVDSSAPDLVSFVGDVPAQGSVKFTLVGAASGCSYTQITIPLDQSTLTNSDLLGEAINAAGGITQVLQWNAGLQQFDSWDPVNNDGTVDGLFTETPFPTKIGYPYMVCGTSAVNNQVWP